MRINELYDATITLIRKFEVYFIFDYKNSNYLSSELLNNEKI
jgi:hypothetical protein